MSDKNQITDVFFDLDHTLWDFEKNSALTFEKIFEEAKRVYRRMPKSRARKELAPEAETDDWGRYLKKALPTVTIRGGPLMTLVKKAIG